MSVRALIIGGASWLGLLYLVGRAYIHDVFKDFAAGPDRKQHLVDCRDAELHAREEKLRFAIANAPELASLRAEARMWGHMASTLTEIRELPTIEPKRFAR